MRRTDGGWWIDDECGDSSGHYCGRAQRWPPGGAAMPNDIVAFTVSRVPGTLGRILERLRRRGYAIPRIIVRVGDNPSFFSVTLTLTGKPLSGRLRRKFVQGEAG